MSNKKALKGIKTQEGLEMAKKRFQLDEDKADLDKDGELSSYERQKGEAVQKVQLDKDMDALKLSGGGILAMDDPYRQELLDTIPELKVADDGSGLTIREGTGHQRYSPVFDGGNFVGFEENPQGPITNFNTKVPGGDGKTSSEYWLLDAWIPATTEKEIPDDETPPSQGMPDPPPDWKRDSENEFDDDNKDSVDPPNNTWNNETENQFDVPKDKSILEKIKEIIGLAHGGLMSESVGYDEPSGNLIPVGSSAENVRDDIPAALSTGEYVLPANVVRWHGLKHIQEMMNEAQMGLMCMRMEGQIHDIAEEESYSKESKDEKSKDEDSATKKGAKDSKEEIETSEGNIIEMASGVIEETIVDDDDSKKGPIVVKKKPKIRLISNL